MNPLIKELETNNIKDRTLVANEIIKKLEANFKYDDDILFHYYPSFHELENYKRGDCYFTSYYYVMGLRASGIPSAVDFSPSWGGNKSGGHTEFVIYNNSEKFESNVNTDHKSGLLNSPKVYRLGEFNNVIISKKLPSKISFLEDNCWVDVTNEHTQVEDLVYKNERIKKDEIYILYVLNKRGVIPVAEANSMNHKIIFKDVGKGNCYKIGKYDGEREYIFNDKFCI